MASLLRPWGPMHVRDSGGDGPALILANSLGADTRMWDALWDRLPGLRRIGFDQRGHGLSATPDQPWNVDDLAGDVLALMDHLGVARAWVMGCSMGGQVAQVLAADHPDRVRGVILSNTAARIGSPEMWEARIAAVAGSGMAGLADAVLDRWFAPDFRASAQVAPWRRMLLAADPQGYAQTCGMIARADLRDRVPRIRCPVLMIAGGADQATPPDLVAGTAALIPGARLVTLPGAGHLPAIDSPADLAALVLGFAEGRP